ncbi:MAG: hypothetical protein HQK96_07820 [Nitrospirae bacterium]|nr:hypothetical protein [Nitrospirota bacterium]
MLNEYSHMPVESIGSIIGPIAVGTSTKWAKKDNCKKKMPKEKKRAGHEKNLIDILV